jgi:hypothetical protein
MANRCCGCCVSSRRFGTVVVQLLEVLWEASDHLCGKRLAAVMPTLVPALERHGHWQDDPDLGQKLLQISPETIDLLPAPARTAHGEQYSRLCPASSPECAEAPRCARSMVGRASGPAGFKWTLWPTVVGAWRARSCGR